MKSFAEHLRLISQNGGSTNAMITTPNFTTRYVKGIPRNDKIESVFLFCRNGETVTIDGHAMEDMTAGEVIDALRSVGVKFNDD